MWSLSCRVLNPYEALKRPSKTQDQKIEKNLRRINIVISPQTLHHLEAMAAAEGWSEKDLGRVVDKLMRTALAERREREVKE